MTESETQEPASVGAEEIRSLIARVELLENACVLDRDRLEALEQNWRGNESLEYDVDHPLVASEGNEGEYLEYNADHPLASEGNEGEALGTAVGHGSSKSELYDKFELPESTFTLLITHKCLSIPFFTGLVACGLALTCLVLVLIDEMGNGTDDNMWGLPAGVSTAVRTAQFLGIIIGVLMEEEIPLGLEIIGKGIKQHESGDSVYKMRRILFSSILRLAVGYLFLLTLFMTVIQESNVLDIFFDVLALEFVESIDDVVFQLCKRGFFGHILRDAARHSYEFSYKKSNQNKKYKLWMNRFIRLIYFLNAGLLVAGLCVLMVNQNNGDYRCKRFSVQFGDDTWDESWVEIVNGDLEQRLLVYSHFNGLYIENGTHDGKPRYVEQNKEDGSPFHSVIPAEFIFCQSAGAWVFRHEKISTTLNIESEDKNECDWLLISPQTESYDIIELADNGDWSVWKGSVERNYQVLITCNECHEDSLSDCNYHGDCIAQTCHCEQGFFGINCEHQSPCKVLQSSKDNATNITLMMDPGDTNVHFVEVYQRPMFMVRNMTGKPFGLLRYGYPDDDDEYFDVTYNSAVTEGAELIPHKHFHADAFADDDFFQVNNATSSFQELLKNYSFTLWYSGRRWYGQIVSQNHTSDSFKEEEFHAFWANSFSGVGSEDKDNETLIISEPSSSGSPEGLEFFEMRRRNIPGSNSEGYGPFGVLIPLIDAEEGAGFFRCVEQADGQPR